MPASFKQLLASSSPYGVLHEKPWCKLGTAASGNTNIMEERCHIYIYRERYITNTPFLQNRGLYELTFLQDGPYFFKVNAL